MQPISILIADNDPMVRQCLRRAVEAGCPLQICWEATDGLQALALAQKHKPQLVLLDAQMKRMSGIEAARCLRNKDLEVRILVLSVYQEECAPAIAAGADAFLVKDSGCEALRSTIRRLMARECNDTQSSEGEGRIS
jgi:two-component system nitrate/nitrite response regulator NarP